LLAGCLEVADGRARRDARVGQASAAGATITVADGLAAVRGLGADHVRLWAQAPVLDVALTVPAGAPSFAIVVENALGDAALTAEDPAIVVSAETRPVPTEGHWTLALPATAARAVRLRLAPPDEAAAGPWRFAAFADVQEKIDEVQDIYARMNEDPTIRFVVMSGDLTSRGSVGELERFQREMKSLNVPIYATLGNHELGTRDDLFHDYFGRGNCHFGFRGAQFTLLDSASATLAPAAYDWLYGWLAGGLDRPHYVFMHIPPLDPAGTRAGAFASRLEANRLLSLLAGGRVDLTIYGHVHSYYAYSNAGIPAYITGGGGAIPEQLDGIGRHYLVVDVDPATQHTTVGLVRVD
jgi:3',5'-cyclic AMP phosphodiesterase CpdA